MNIIDGKGKFARLAIGGMAVISLAAWLHAQFQVQPTAAVGQVNPQINAELNGYGTVNSVKYSSQNSIALPSEVRYAYWKSGALPSDIRMGYAALGPLTPGGAMDYIPPPPSYLSKPVTPPPAAMGASAYGTGATIRYSSPAPRTAVSAPRVGAPMVSPARVSSGPINAGPLNNTVRYGR